MTAFWLWCILTDFFFKKRKPAVKHVGAVCASHLKMPFDKL